MRRLWLAAIFAVGCSPSFPAMRAGESGCPNVSGRYLLESVARLDDSTNKPKFPRCAFLDILFDHGMSESASCLLPPVMEIRQQGCGRLEYWWIWDSSETKGGELAIAEVRRNWLELDVSEHRKSWCVATFTSCRKTTALIRMGISDEGSLVLWEQVRAEGGILTDIHSEAGYTFAAARW